MSNKLVIPTLETQQKYPLFYAEATKTINDIIEHISKERGIYLSSIEPDPKEHSIWFNEDNKKLYMYDETYKRFTSVSGDINIDEIHEFINDKVHKIVYCDNFTDIGHRNDTLYVLKNFTDDNNFTFYVDGDYDFEILSVYSNPLNFSDAKNDYAYTANDVVLIRINHGYVDVKVYNSKLTIST